MPLAVYDTDGRITQVFLQAAVGLEIVSARYAEMNIPHVLTDADVDIATCYVFNGQVMPKPQIVVTGDNRPVKADGADTITFQIAPESFNAKTLFNGTLISDDDVTDGTIEFAADQAGTYQVMIVAAFPYQGTILTIEATE
jgi:hypothetical protein